MGYDFVEVGGGSMADPAAEKHLQGLADIKVVKSESEVVDWIESWRRSQWGYGPSAEYSPLDTSRCVAAPEQQLIVVNLG